MRLNKHVNVQVIHILTIMELLVLMQLVKNYYLVLKIILDSFLGQTWFLLNFYSLSKSLERTILLNSNGSIMLQHDVGFN